MTKTIPIKEIMDDLPLTREQVAAKIKEIEDDTAELYGSIVRASVDQTLALVHAIGAKNQPRLLQHIVGEMDNDILTRLEKIAIALSCEEVESVSEIFNQSYGFQPPSAETIAQATEFLKKIVSLDDDPEAKAHQLAAHARDIYFLASAIAIANLGENYRLATFDRICQLPLGDIQKMIKLFDELVVK